MIHKFASVVTGAQRLTATAKLLDVPVLVTEQYPKGLGPTVGDLASAFADAQVSKFEKTDFTMVTERVKEALKNAPFQGREHVVLVGLEAHVCVQQTTLDLLEMGYGVHLCVDAISSQQPTDRAAGLTRVDRAGAFITTTESVSKKSLLTSPRNAISSSPASIPCPGPSMAGPSPCPGPVQNYSSSRTPPASFNPANSRASNRRS